MNGPAVFIANDINLDLSSLNKWGCVVSVFRTHLFPDTVDEMYHYIKIAKEKLEHYDPQCDTIAMVGDPILTSLIVACVVEKGINRFTLLKYDRKLCAYYPVTIDIGNKNEQNDKRRDINGNTEFGCSI